MTFEEVRQIVLRGGHAEAAIQYDKIANDHKLTPDVRSWSCYLGAIQETQLNRLENAIQTCVSGMQECPTMAELPWYAAYCASRLGDHLRAIAFARMSLAITDRQMPPTTYPSWMRHPPAWNEGPYDVLRFAYRSIGDDERANWAEAMYRQLTASRSPEETPFANSLMKWRPEIIGWSADILPFYDRLAEEFLASRFRYEDPFAFVEIGVFHGRSILFLAERLLQEIKQAGPESEVNDVSLIAVDVDLSKFYPNAARLNDRLPIESYELASVESASCIERSFDVVFIDALHDYESVKQDIQAWGGKVKPLGLLSGHDYMHAGEHAGVGRAVDEAFGRENVLVEGSVWQVRRKLGPYPNGEIRWEHP